MIELHAVAQVAPERLGRRRAGEAPGHPDDRDIGGRGGRAGCGSGRAGVRLSLPGKVRRQRPDSRVAEQVHHRQVAPEPVADLLLDLHQQQRVAALVKEVLVGADRGAPQHGRPDLGQRRLHRRVGRREGRGLGFLAPVGLRQRPPVDLIGGRGGQPLQQHKRRRHHIVGEVLFEEPAQLIN